MPRRGDTFEWCNWLEVIARVMDSVHLCKWGMASIPDQWTCPGALADCGLIFHGVQVAREEELYLWSAKHCGTLWETTYIPLVRKHLNIYSCSSEGEATPPPMPHNPCPKLSFTHFPDRKLWEVDQSWCVLWNVVLGFLDYSSAHQACVGADANNDLGHLAPSSSAALGSCTGRSQRSPYWWGALKL